MIHWLVQTTASHPDLERAIAPPGVLSAAEVQRLESFKVAKRRREWLLGRWTAKHLLQSYVLETRGLCVPLDALVVERDRDGAPYATLDSTYTSAFFPEGGRRGSGESPLSLLGRGVGGEGERLSVSLSISHSSETAFCALYPLNGFSHPNGAGLETATQLHLVQVGADIERIEPRSESFVQSYFTRDEIQWLESAPAAWRAVLQTATWSAKEAVLKALRLGLSVNTQRLTCLCSLPAPGAIGWSPIEVRCDPTLLPEAAQRTSGPARDQAMGGSPFAVQGWWQIVPEPAHGAAGATAETMHDGVSASTSPALARFVLTLAALQVWQPACPA